MLHFISQLLVKLSPLVNISRMTDINPEWSILFTVENILSIESEKTSILS